MPYTTKQKQELMEQAALDAHWAGTIGSNMKLERLSLDTARSLIKRLNKALASAKEYEQAMIEIPEPK
jgi:hypothetical protein